MLQIIDINTLRKNANDKPRVDEGLENELIGFTKQLFWGQLTENYDKDEIVNMMYSFLSSENRCMVDSFIEENPNLKIKYNNLSLRCLKKSAN